MNDLALLKARGPCRPRDKLVGMRFGRLLVIARAPNYRGFSQWVCKCDCGKESITANVRLMRGVQSCGCLCKEKTLEAIVTHGLSRTRVYKIWAGMLKRCENEKDKSYRYYGGRGIKVCASWHDFQLFYADMGEPNGLTIDRIKNDKDYEPGNCRWATRLTQAQNRRKAITV